MLFRSSNILQTRLCYTSRELSVGPVQFNRARHYDVTTGRFLLQEASGRDVVVPCAVVLHRSDRQLAARVAEARLQDVRRSEEHRGGEPTGLVTRIYTYQTKNRERTVQ